jgi:monovalent cation:H+ antiporter-2, CPA2 family
MWTMPLTTMLAAGPADAHHAVATFLEDLAMVMLVAGVVTIVFHVLKQPVVLGYIVAGLIVGPHTDWIPLAVRDTTTISIMSELGVILLMFSLGLHFSLRKLASVGATAVIAATLEIVLLSGIGYGIGRAFGWSNMDSIFLGAILSISSTTIIIKALAELGLVKEKFAELIFGILIVEDILAIAMLAMLSGIAGSGTLGLGAVAITLGKLTIFLGSVLVFGLLTVPLLLRFVARFRSNEMLLITALALCFGVSLLALKLEYSVALGAFLIGAVVAEAREHHKVEGLVEPVRDMFSAVFFVAIGMLIDPMVLKDHWFAIIVITIAVIVGKVFACSLGTFLAGHSPRTSVKVGMGLSQIGEFSFIIAQLGLTLKVTSEFLYPIAVAVSALTTLSTPYLIRSSDRVVGTGARLVPEWLSNAADTYAAWLGRSSPSENSGRVQVRRLLRKLTLQLMLNMLLITGILLTGAAVASSLRQHWPVVPIWTGGPRAVMWLAGILIALPLIIVTLRKLRVVAHLIAEASVPGTPGEARPQARMVLAGALYFVAWFGMCLWILVASAAMLPPWPMLVIALMAVITFAAFRWRSMERVYASAQSSLRETLSRPPEAPPVERRVLPTILDEAKLEMVPITAVSPASGKLIRELALRTRTGASAVAIERAGDATNVINPGPDEEVAAGDSLLLLGNREQLDAALAMLSPRQVGEIRSTC